MELKMGPFPERWVRYWFRQMVQGLKHIHSTGHAHLDIKVDNILLDGDLNIKIADFGFALNDHHNVQILRGSSFYRSPEIMRGQIPFDGEKADVFALGCTLYTLLMRAYPFGRGTDVTKSLQYSYIANQNY